MPTVLPSRPKRVHPQALVTEGRRRPVKRRRHVSWFHERAQKNVPEPAKPRRLVAWSCTLCALALLLAIALGVSAGSLDNVALAAAVVETTTSADDSFSQRYLGNSNANTKLQVSSPSSAAVANTTQRVSATNGTPSYASDAAEEQMIPCPNGPPPIRVVNGCGGMPLSSAPEDPAELDAG
ncbi:hypothetical protein MTO96_004761 [Rhipicephalus appendiculatus]